MEPVLFADQAGVPQLPTAWCGCRLKMTDAYLAVMTHIARRRVDEIAKLQRQINRLRRQLEALSAENERLHNENAVYPASK